MIPVYQTDISDTTGDCLRACIASIFEFGIKEMPNFWEQTQDGLKFMRLANVWVKEHLDYSLVHIEIDEDLLEVTKNVLCIAIAKSNICDDVYHAVVWKDGIIHDPNPEKPGFSEEPTIFIFFAPLDVRQWRMRYEQR